MVQEVIWTGSAYKDLQNIVEFIAIDSEYYAMSFYEDVMDKAQTLNIFPHRGRVVPELNDQNMREIFIHSYRLIYKTFEDKIYIATIIHSAKVLKGN